jgi:hypothetical protein
MRTQLRPRFAWEREYGSRTIVLATSEYTGFVMSSAWASASSAVRLNSSGASSGRCTHGVPGELHPALQCKPQTTWSQSKHNTHTHTRARTHAHTHRHARTRTRTHAHIPRQESGWWRGGSRHRRAARLLCTQCHRPPIALRSNRPRRSRTTDGTSFYGRPSPRAETHCSDPCHRNAAGPLSSRAY